MTDNEATPLTQHEPDAAEPPRDHLAVEEPTLTLDDLFASLGRANARNDALTRTMIRLTAELNAAIAQRDAAQAALEAIGTPTGGNT